jgi:hypothetical protein
MTAQEDKVLAVAREVWKKSAPSDERTERAAQRIARRMRISAHRPSRRPLGYVAFAVVLIGALAYAASGGLSSESGPRRTVQTPPTTTESPAGGTPVVQENKANSAQHGHEESAPTVEERTPPKSASPSSGSAGASGSSSNGKHKKIGPSDPAAAAAAAASSWREVDEALGAKDDTRAEKALNGLATSNDATTRAKAKLGLAQLARSQNDCPRATALANEVITMPDVDPVVVKRAQVIAKACQ